MHLLLNFKPQIRRHRRLRQLHELLMQYRDCYLILTGDPPHADCILRLTRSSDEARRAGGGSKSGRSYSPQTFRRRGRGNRCAILQRRSPTDSSAVGFLEMCVGSRIPIRSCDRARACSLERRHSDGPPLLGPFVVCCTRSRQAVGTLGQGLPAVSYCGRDCPQTYVAV
jgi:hypothetical protein